MVVLVVLDKVLWTVCCGWSVVEEEWCLLSKLFVVVKVVCCCQSCLLLSELFVVIYMTCVLNIVYTAKRPVATGSDRSFIFCETFGLATKKFQDQGQLQLVVQSFAVGFSPVPVIFSV
jgi:hypothetical protein